MIDNLPVEHENNIKILKPQNEGFKLYFGTNKWGRTEWIGKLYPEGTKERDFLDYYVQSFNAVELQATHYNQYPTEAIKKWAGKAEGRDFVFCPKFPQSISHYSSFTNMEEKTHAFIDSIRALGDHLGPIFLQVSDRFSPKKQDALFNYLSELPKDLQFFLEVRNPDWFEKSTHNILLSFLAYHKIGLVIRDKADLLKQISLTVPKCWIRYSPGGNNNRISNWVKKIKEWERKGLKEAYFFVESYADTDETLVIEELDLFRTLWSKE